MTTYVKLCPFCGKRGTIIEVDGQFKVSCENPECEVNVCTNSFPSARAAALAWNGRPRMSREERVKRSQHKLARKDTPQFRAAMGKWWLMDCEKASDEMMKWAYERGFERGFEHEILLGEEEE